MKKHKRIIGALFLVAIFAVVQYACTKERSQADAKPMPEQTSRKPIATYDNATGQMKYHLTTEMIQKCLERTSLSKENDRFIVEAFEIVTLGSDNDEKGIRFSVIDTESEELYKVFLNSAFLEKKTLNDSIVFYIAGDVESGSFTFTNFLKDGVYTLTLSNFEVVDVEAVPDSLICTAPRPKRTVTCRSRGCVIGGCEVYYDMYANPVGCTPCGNPPSENVWCEQTITDGGNGNEIGLLGIALTILFGVLPYIL